MDQIIWRQDWNFIMQRLKCRIFWLQELFILFTNPSAACRFLPHHFQNVISASMPDFAYFCWFSVVFILLELTSQHKFATKMSSPLKSGYNLTLFHKGLFLVKCNSTLKRQFQTLKRILHIINHFSSRLWPLNILFAHQRASLKELKQF